jgi:hypothetical protein
MNIKDTERLSGKKMHPKTALSALMVLCFVIMGGLSGCTLHREKPNEADSVKGICSISISDCDYDFYQANMGYGYRIHDKRELYIGNKTDGMAYDGTSAYQYINGKQIATKGFVSKSFRMDTTRDTTMTAPHIDSYTTISESLRKDSRYSPIRSMRGE